MSRRTTALTPTCDVKFCYDYALLLLAKPYQAGFTARCRGRLGFFPEHFRLPNSLVNALDLAPPETQGETRAALGMAHALAHYPGAVVVIGNAPTALVKLCELYPTLAAPPPALVIAAPVGFVHVLEAKAQLAQTPVPHILVQGRKGGSAAAAAILNALVDLVIEHWATSSKSPHQTASRAD